MSWHSAWGIAHPSAASPLRRRRQRGTLALVGALPRRQWGPIRFRGHIPGLLTIGQLQEDGFEQLAHVGALVTADPVPIFLWPRGFEQEHEQNVAGLFPRRGA